MTHFKCGVFNFRTVQVSNSMLHRLEYDKFLCTIWRYSLGEFCIQRHGKVKNNLTMLKCIHDLGDEVLGLVEGLSDLGPFPLRDEVGIGVAC